MPRRISVKVCILPPEGRTTWTSVASTCTVAELKEQCIAEGFMNSNQRLLVVHDLLLRELAEMDLHICRREAAIADAAGQPAKHLSVLALREDRARSALAYSQTMCGFGNICLADSGDDEPNAESHTLDPRRSLREVALYQ